jgi:CO/xanthine dehydrogenase FAD-binding subunit
VRSHLRQYEMQSPRELSEALDLLARAPGEWRPFAGGTDIMVLLEQGKLPHRRFVSLWNLRELRGIEVTHAHVTLGGLTTYSEVQAHSVLQKEFPLLCRAAAETGGIATQNRGTLAGNIANASPAADSPPALLVYDAELKLTSNRGARWMRYANVHIGYKQLAIAPDELIELIRLPRTTSGWRQHYRKVGTRRAQAISTVCLAAAARMEGGVIRDVRIAMGSVAPTVVRCEKTEAILRGATPGDVARSAREELAREIKPIDDMRSTARYRTRVAQNLIEEFLLFLSTSPPASGLQ